MAKEPLTQIQEAQRVPYKINPRRNTLRQILIKLTKIKDKEKILKASQGKESSNIQGNPNKVISRFFSRNSAVQSEWHDRLNMMKGKNLQPRLLYPARLSFRFEGKIKTFTDKQKLREFSNTKTDLQQILKELLQTERKGCNRKQKYHK